MPAARRQPGYVLQLEIKVWRNGSQRCRQDESARGRESPAQANRRGSGAQHRRLENGRVGKILTPAQKRRVVQAARDQFDISERQACRYLRVNRRMIRYVRIAKNDAELRARLEELAAERRRFGFRRLAVLLRRDGLLVNIKRVLRVYREANLQVRKRIRRRVALGRGNPAVAVATMNERWSLDFVHDSLESGRRIRTLNIVDDFTRECLAIEVDTSLSGVRVTRVLDAIGSVRGYPETIVLYHGTETGIAMACWARDRKVTKATFFEEFKELCLKCDVPLDRWYRGERALRYARASDEFDLEVMRALLDATNDEGRTVLTIAQRNAAVGRIQRARRILEHALGLSQAEIDLLNK